MSFRQAVAVLIFLTLAVSMIKPTPAGRDGAISDAVPFSQKTRLRQIDRDNIKIELDKLHSNVVSQDLTRQTGEILSLEPGNDYTYGSPDTVPLAPFVAGAAMDVQSHPVDGKADIAKTVAAILSSAPAAVAEAIRNTPDKATPRASKE